MWPRIIQRQDGIKKNVSRNRSTETAVTAVEIVFNEELSMASEDGTYNKQSKFYNLLE
jgi:hypothetical protein